MPEDKGKARVLRSRCVCLYGRRGNRRLLNQLRCLSSETKVEFEKGTVFNEDHLIKDTRVFVKEAGDFERGSKCPGGKYTCFDGPPDTSCELRD